VFQRLALAAVAGEATPGTQPERVAAAAVVRVPPRNQLPPTEQQIQVAVAAAVDSKSLHSAATAVTAVPALSFSAPKILLNLFQDIL